MLNFGSNLKQFRDIFNYMLKHHNMNMLDLFGVFISNHSKAMLLVYIVACIY